MVHQPTHLLLHLHLHLHQHKRQLLPLTPTTQETTQATTTAPAESRRYNLRPPTSRNRPQRHNHLSHLLSTKVNNSILNQALLNSLDWSTHTTEYSKQFFQATELIEPATGLLEIMSPFALAVKANSADTPNWFEAMNGPLADCYWK